jgi:hypothetical protein
MAAVQDRVWGLHEFVAENPDEVSFKVGEVVMIVERDDQYGDGWWQVSACLYRDVWSRVVGLCIQVY